MPSPRVIELAEDEKYSKEWKERLSFRVTRSRCYSKAGSGQQCSRERGHSGLHAIWQSRIDSHSTSGSEGLNPVRYWVRDL